MFCCYHADLAVVDQKIEATGTVRIPSYTDKDGLKLDGNEVNLKIDVDIIDQTIEATGTFKDTHKSNGNEINFKIDLDIINKELNIDLNSMIIVNI